jgi:hypothetical protein
MAILGMMVLIAVVPVGHSQQKADPTDVKPLLVLYGRNSKIKKPKLLRITADEQWRALWMEHKTGSPKPQDVARELEYAELNFESVTAIAVFEGEGVCTVGVTPNSIKEVNGRIVVRLEANFFQTNIAHGISDCLIAQPWGIIVLPRSNKEIILERADYLRSIAEPPEWKESTRFPALTEKKR